jgi:hypothetical protein
MGRTHSVEVASEGDLCERLPFVTFSLIPVGNHICCNALDELDEALEELLGGITFRRHIALKAASIIHGI